MKIKTMLKFLLCFFIIGSLSVSIICAATSGGPNASAFFGAANFNGMGSAEGVVNDVLSGDMGAPVLHIQSLLMFLGSLCAIVVVLIYGIQWVTAPSAKRQELKAGMWPLIIGVTLLVIGPALVSVIYEAISKNSNSDVVTHVNTVAGNVINVVQLVGYLAAVVMILVVGIQWLTAAPSRRQELKGRMINIIVGAILIAGGVTLLGWVSQIATHDMKTASIVIEIYKT